MNMPEQHLNKQIVSRLVTEVVNTGNVALLGELMSPDYVASHGMGRVADGIAGMARHGQACDRRKGNLP